MERHATVLVAEDEPDIRVLVRVNLSLAGLRVLEASTGEEAVEIALREHPDVLVLDLRLPVWEGWEVLRRLRATGSRTRVVICTAEALVETERRARDEGCVYLPKPFTMDALDAAVGQAITSRS